MRYFLTILLMLIAGDCSAQDKYLTGTISEMELFEDTGCIMLTVQINGSLSHILIQGISTRDLIRYDEDIGRTWSPITNLEINVTSYSHSYPDNGLSDGLAYDEVEIWSAPGSRKQNSAHIAPALTAMLPYQSCRFVGIKDRTLVWVGPATKDFHMKGAVLQFISSVGHDTTNPVHQD